MSWCPGLVYTIKAWCLFKKSTRSLSGRPFSVGIPRRRITPRSISNFSLRRYSYSHRWLRAQRNHSNNQFYLRHFLLLFFCFEASSKFVFAGIIRLSENVADPRIPQQVTSPHLTSFSTLDAPAKSGNNDLILSKEP